MEVRSIRKLETRHVNLKPTEHSRFLIFILTDIWENVTMMDSLEIIADVMTQELGHIQALLFRYNRLRCCVQTARLLTETSVSLDRSCPIISAFSRDMNFDQKLHVQNRENRVTDVFVFLVHQSQKPLSFPLKHVLKTS